MKKLLFAALLFVCTPAMAEAPPPPTTPPPAAAGGEGVRPEINFEEHKARKLKIMDEHIASIQKRQACVKAAENLETMRDCFPKRKYTGYRMERRGGRDGVPGFGNVTGHNAPEQDTPHHGR